MERTLGVNPWSEPLDWWRQASDSDGWSPASEWALEAV
jgi:hypothetical protein